ncbi:Transcription factor bHLH27 [Camellia lanceoleosa]|uniref:Transcription factor bHLH27 n=1 Tax=Camellia lanceoleosa TaxID=1840588 RepID=A0ACC0GFW5_9ERIC|nr:Transcription factor bHLH27 [Camellia lanceoleosa]
MADLHVCSLLSFHCLFLLNIVSERNRRKKLNDRLFALRVVVPKISKRFQPCQDSRKRELIIVMIQGDQPLLPLKILKFASIPSVRSDG